MSHALSFLRSVFPGYTSLQLQASFAGLSWEWWLIILLLIILLVWWLITRQGRDSRSIDESATRHADVHSQEHASEPAQEGPIMPASESVESPQPFVAAIAPEPPGQVIEAAPPMPEPANQEPNSSHDNIEIIEGIGPKIAAILKEAGISTFSQLSTTSPARLLEILHASGLRVNDPTSWPDQARLAAAGDWEGLQKMQDSLKAGRRMENI